MFLFEALFCDVYVNIPVHLTWEDVKFKREAKFLQETDPLQPLGVGEIFIMWGL